MENTVDLCRRPETDLPPSLVFQSGILWKDVAIWASVSPVAIIGSKENKGL